MANMYYENYKNALESLKIKEYKGNSTDLNSIYFSTVYRALIALNQAIKQPFKITPHEEIPKHIAIMLTRVCTENSFKIHADLTLIETGNETYKDIYPNTLDIGVGIACYDNKFPLATVDDLDNMALYCASLHNYILENDEDSINMIFGLPPAEKASGISKTTLLNTPIVIGTLDPIDTDICKNGIYYDAIENGEVTVDNLCSIVNCRKVHLGNVQSYLPEFKDSVREYAMIL